MLREPASVLGLCYREQAAIIAPNGIPDAEDGMASFPFNQLNHSSLDRKVDGSARSKGEFRALLIHLLEPLMNGG